MDFDRQKIRMLRMFMHTGEYLILFLLLCCIAFFAYFVFGGPRGFDFRFFSFFCVPFFIMGFYEIKERLDPSPILVKMNRFWDKEGIHIRQPTETERNIASYFYEEKGIKMPKLFTCDKPCGYNAFMCRYNTNELVAVTEQSYRDFSPQHICVMLAHENGHLENGDMYKIILENIVFFLAQWLSWLVILKIVISPSFELLYSPFLHFLMVYVAICFLAVACAKSKFLLTRCKDILADISAVQTLGSVSCVLEFFYLLNSRVHFPCFQEREKALLFIQKKKIEAVDVK